MNVSEEALPRRQGISLASLWAGKRVVLALLLGIAFFGGAFGLLAARAPHGIVWGVCIAFLVVFLICVATAILVKLGYNAEMPVDWNDHQGWDDYYRNRLRWNQWHDSLAHFVVGPFLVKQLPAWAETARSRGQTSVWLPGCGFSPLPRLLAHLGLTVVATDISPAAVEFQLSERIDVDAFKLGPAVPGGSLEAVVHDHRSAFRREAFDLILNIKAFQGHRGADRLQAARSHALALKPGGTAHFDTINVQGDLRDRLEDALAEAGFHVPLRELEREYRAALRATGIPLALVLGSPVIPQMDEHGQPVLWWDDEPRRRAAEAELRRIAAEYEEMFEHAARAEEAALDPQAKLAVISYSTG